MNTWKKNEHKGSFKKFLKSRGVPFYNSFKGGEPFTYIPHEGIVKLREFAKMRKVYFGEDENETINQVKKILKRKRKLKQGAFDESNQQVSDDS